MVRSADCVLFVLTGDCAVTLSEFLQSPSDWQFVHVANRIFHKCRCEGPLRLCIGRLRTLAARMRDHDNLVKAVRREDPDGDLIMWCLHVQQVRHRAGSIEILRQLLSKQRIRDWYVEEPSSSVGCRVCESDVVVIDDKFDAKSRRKKIAYCMKKRGAIKVIFESMNAELHGHCRTKQIETACRILAQFDVPNRVQAECVGVVCRSLAIFNDNVAFYRLGLELLADMAICAGHSVGEPEVVAAISHVVNFHSDDSKLLEAACRLVVTLHGVATDAAGEKEVLVGELVKHRVLPHLVVVQECYFSKHGLMIVHVWDTIATFMPFTKDVNCHVLVSMIWWSLEECFGKEVGRKPPPYMLQRMLKVLQILVLDDGGSKCITVTMLDLVWRVHEEELYQGLCFPPVCSLLVALSESGKWLNWFAQREVAKSFIQMMRSSLSSVEWSEECCALDVLLRLSGGEGSVTGGAVGWCGWDLWAPALYVPARSLPRGW